MLADAGVAARTEFGIARHLSFLTNPHIVQSPQLSSRVTRPRKHGYRLAVGISLLSNDKQRYMLYAISTSG